MQDKRNKFSYSKLDVTKFSCTKFFKGGTVDNVMRRARKVKPLTVCEEQEFIKRIKNGDAESDMLKNRIMISHQPFVINLVNYYYKGNDENVFLDLMQEANYGMLIAFERYNPDSSAKFITYANAWMLKYILRYIKNNTIVRNKDWDNLDVKAAKVKEKYIQKYNYEPTNDELLVILQEMGENVSSVNDVIPMNIISIDAKNNDGDDVDDVYEIPYIDDNMEQSLQLEMLSDAVKIGLSILEPEERNVVELYFGIDKWTAKDIKSISIELKISEKECNRLYKIAMNKLKLYFNNKQIA